MALNVALASAGLQVRPLVYWHGRLSVLNRCTEPRKRKITTAKIAVKAARYLYCVKRNELAPGHKMILAKQKLRHEPSKCLNIWNARIHRNFKWNS